MYLGDGGIKGNESVDLCAKKAIMLGSRVYNMCFPVTCNVVLSDKRDKPGTLVGYIPAYLWVKKMKSNQNYPPNIGSSLGNKCRRILLPRSFVYA